MEFVQELLETLDKYDQHSDLFWRTGNKYGGGIFEKPASFLINCSDVFWWGSADAEEITPDNISLLRQSYEDCYRLYGYVGAIHGSTLFAARVRKMRPQGAAYPDDMPEICRLLNECGPKREVGLGNPKECPIE